MQAQPREDARARASGFWRHIDGLFSARSAVLFAIPAAAAAEPNPRYRSVEWSGTAMRLPFPRLKRPACKEEVQFSTDMAEPDGKLVLALYPFANLGTKGAVIGDGVPFVAEDVHECKHCRWRICMKRTIECGSLLA